MAIIKMGQFVAEARNKLGGLVFSRNTYGAYVRTKISPINPSSTPQSLVRARLAQVSQAWRGLTDAQRSAWIQAAPNFSRINVFGDSVPLTGFNLHEKINLNLLNIGESLITVPPSDTNVAGLTQFELSLTYVEGGLTEMNLKTEHTGGAADHALVLFGTPGQSPGKSFVGPELRQFHKISPLSNAETTTDVLTQYNARFGAPTADQRVFVRARLIKIASGLPSGRMQDSIIIADAA